MTQPVKRVALGHDSSQLISVLALLPDHLHGIEATNHWVCNLVDFSMGAFSQDLKKLVVTDPRPIDFRYPPLGLQKSGVQVSGIRL